MGPLVYVMGPSGAGKDSVMNRARELLAGTAPVFFAHRYITRPADIGGENHVALSEAEFLQRRDHGLLAFDWEAHGYRYGVGSEIQTWRKAGLAVVVSGSREHFLRANGVDAETHPVLITAPADRLAQRLAARGREDSGATTERLGRGEAYTVDDPRLVTIVNDGVLETAAQAFVSLIARLQYSPDARRRA